MTGSRPHLPEIATGDDAADRLYRRLLERRRQLLEARRTGDDAAHPGTGATAPAAAMAATGATTAEPPMPAAIDPEAPLTNAEGPSMTAPDPGNQAPPRHVAAVFLPGDGDQHRSRSAPRGSGSTDWLHPRLSDWQPESQTMRFIKDHPALTIAIGVPALIVLARNGGLRRLVRYASSPAGVARIRQLAAVAAGLGLLSKRR
jgi:hypothetical protein